MADFQIAYDWMMENEDARRACVSVADPTEHNPCARAISGINSAYFPVEFSAIDAAAGERRAELVRAFYGARFWNGYLSQLASDEVAKRVFDAMVNMGAGTGVRLLQESISDPASESHIHVKADGVLGPLTVRAANAATDFQLVKVFKARRAAHYKEIGGPNLAAWLKRAAK